MAHILVVDDEPGIRSVLKQLFDYEGHTADVAGDASEAITAFRAHRPDLTFLDVKLPRVDGLELLAEFRRLDPGAIVVMISGHGTIQTAVEATQRGAWDFLEKPLDTDRILVTIRNALDTRGARIENQRLRQEVEQRYDIVGATPVIRSMLAVIERVAPTDARILISGENGTGKELVARALHALSSRVRGPFVEVNCAAIPSELIESELFGHVKGSFTGAVNDRPGKFEQAHGGTLFLDEIGDMSLAAQAKVLRVLQDGVITRVGGQSSIPVDVRVVTATNKRLGDEIATGHFREDLFFRLNVIPIEMPPLRTRAQDIPMLVSHFSEAASRQQGLYQKEFEQEALDRLCRMDWPGNVRELRNTVERLLILSDGPVVTGHDVVQLVSGGLASAISADPFALDSFAAFKERAEQMYIERKLSENGWNVSETARILEMPRSNLYKKIERYGLSRLEEGRSLTEREN